MTTNPTNEGVDPRASIESISHRSSDTGLSGAVESADQSLVQELGWLGAIALLGMLLMLLLIFP